MAQDPANTADRHPAQVPGVSECECSGEQPRAAPARP